MVETVLSANDRAQAQREKAVKQREEQLALLERIAEALERIADVMETEPNEDISIRLDSVRAEAQRDILERVQTTIGAPDGDGDREPVRSGGVSD